MAGLKRLEPQPTEVGEYVGPDNPAVVGDGRRPAPNDAESFEPAIEVGGDRELRRFDVGPLPRSHP